MSFLRRPIQTLLRAQPPSRCFSSALPVLSPFRSLPIRSQTSISSLLSNLSLAPASKTSPHGSLRNGCESSRNFYLPKGARKVKSALARPKKTARAAGKRKAKRRRLRMNQVN